MPCPSFWSSALRASPAPWRTDRAPRPRRAPHVAMDRAAGVPPRVSCWSMEQLGFQHVSTQVVPLGGLSRPWGRPWGFVIRIAFFFDIWCLYPCFFVFFAASLVVSKVFLFKFPSFVISGTSNIEKEAARWCGASDVHPFQDGIPTGASPELPPQENRDTLSPQKSSAKSQGYFIATPKTTLIPQSNIATTGIDGPKNSPMI